MASVGYLFSAVRSSKVTVQLDESLAIHQHVRNEDGHRTSVLEMC